MRVIIADDHPLYREAVRLRVERSFPSARTWEAGSLDELLALRAVIDGKPDLILLDLHMPGMTDASLVARVVETFDAPVALVSGLANAADITSAVQAGARGFLPKTRRRSYSRARCP
jgi:DNA-binding NarL/FixJ family response regulator